jgi:shikimate kinase
VVTDHIRKPPNVVLTGFMGTGKSTVGCVLAIQLGYDWVDTDKVIESRHGPIIEIFATNGEEAFREMERSLARELATEGGLVISTGGRMMLDRSVADLLGENGRVFCLVAAVDEVVRRVAEPDDPDRPLLAGGHPADRIAALLAEREEGYRRFEQVVTDGRTVEEVVTDLVCRLEEDA